MPGAVEGLRRFETAECRYVYFSTRAARCERASRRATEELIAFGHELRAAVLAWLKKTHPNLTPE